jgi:hypothetical protein
MRRINTCVAIAGLAAVIFSALPAAAISVRVGPYYFSFPLFRHWRRHHRHYVRAAPNDHAPAESKQGMASALFYPQLELPITYASIFSPSSASSWPFDYQTILSTAFAKVPPQPNPQLCRPQPDLGTKIIAPIRTELAPTDTQIQLLEKLGGALSAAAEALEKSCPSAIPGQPIARLQLIGSQIKELAMAIETVGNPLQDFARSLNDEQRARFAVMIAAPTGADRDTGSGNIATRCGGPSSASDRLIGQIDKSVQPTGVQRDALADVKQAIDKAASDLATHCPTLLPLTAVSRLEAVEAQLDATGRSVSSIEVALANFETKLSDDQKDRFNAMNFVAAGKP